MDARMVSFWGCESNPVADSNTANNGGGYFQPSGGMLVALENGDYLTVSVDDLSCGEFGSRIFWSVVSTDGRCWGGCYGTMDDAAIDWVSSEDLLDSISGVYGISARAMLADAIKAVCIAAYC